MWQNEEVLENPEIHGIKLYPRLFTADVFRQRFSRLLTETQCLYILPSAGMGYGLDWLLHNDLPASSRLIVFDMIPELSDMRRQYNFLRDQLAAKPNIHFCDEHNETAMRLYLMRQLHMPGRQRRVRTLRLCSLPSGVKNLPQLLEQDAAARIRQWWRNHSTSIFMAPLWVKNLFDNMLDGIIVDSQTQTTATGQTDLSVVLQELTARRPVLLLGAGPSLNDAIAALKTASQAKGGALLQEYCICAVDTAVPALLEADIVPQLVFMLEAQFANMDDFICSSAFARLNAARTLLVHDLTGHPPTLRRFARRSAVLSNFAPSRFLDEVPTSAQRIAPLGSVGVAALYMLLRFTDSQLYTAGFDFAFRAGSTHARCTPTHQSILRKSNRMSPVSLWAMQGASHSIIQPDARAAELNTAHATDGQQGPTYSDEVMKLYFDSFCEVIGLYGQSRVFVFRHRGLSFPNTLVKYAEFLPESPGESLSIPSQHPTEKTKNSPLTQPHGETEVISWLNDIRSDLRELQNSLSRLLSAFTPAQKGCAVSSPEFERQWSLCLQLLASRDFVWRFLPGALEPEYSQAFLIPLARSLQYWLKCLERSLKRAES